MQPKRVQALVVDRWHLKVRTDALDQEIKNADDSQEHPATLAAKSALLVAQRKLLEALDWEINTAWVIDLIPRPD